MPVLAPFVDMLVYVKVKRMEFQVDTFKDVWMKERPK